MLIDHAKIKEPNATFQSTRKRRYMLPIKIANPKTLIIIIFFLLIVQNFNFMLKYFI